ncbi:BatA domain-containing protein [Lutibacter citreus]|uniref:BatA domain-containing protein n=1 Tax=Lutibacter citreus TaxID=2138210 RepID=UPI000DBE7A2D|nr:BatA domain-containing protein [Lutibacter citreus]
MQFKHPELLFALFALIIPIVIHLFQLQRFVKIPFTNVKFLKNIEQQTRKSARLKKWLILFCRLLAFACLIIAFCQPYFSNYTKDYKFNTTLYLDNSYSMQAKGKSGELFKRNVQTIIDNYSNKNEQISIITNNDILTNIDSKNLKNSLLNIDYSPFKLNLNTALLKLNNQNKKSINTLNKNILISDFQNINHINKNFVTNVNSSINLLKVSPEKSDNIYIDSVYIKEQNTNEILLNIEIKSTKNNNLNIPISLYNNEKLIGKTSARFNNKNQTNVQFSIPVENNFNGKISLIDNGLKFDNDFFFSMSKPQKINVLNLGLPSSFLSKIYTQSEFNFLSSSIKNLNYNTIQKQDLIVLNEIEIFPIELTNVLNEFIVNGGNLVLIPSLNANIASYNSFLNKLNIGSISTLNNTEHKITSINFEHPLITDVFEKQVKNFQYPKTNSHYIGNFKGSSTIISFDNNSPFISSVNREKSIIYVVSAPLNKSVSNFTQSPLIVPVFYNFAKHSSKFSELYYTIKHNINIDINTKLNKDEVLKISHNNKNFIPLQQVFQNKVRLSFQDNILKSGFYEVLKGDATIQTIAFNYNREESDLSYLNLKEIIKNNKNLTISSSFDELFDEIHNEQKINWLFKWFLAFSVLFLFLEILILKYFNI